VGFDSVATVAEEAKSRTLPVPYAMIASVVFSCLIYIGICTVMVGLVSYKILDTNDPLSDAM
jgi:APA family basic amino acid/polyamine antiporter